MFNSYFLQKKKKNIIEVNFSPWYFICNEFYTNFEITIILNWKGWILIVSVLFQYLKSRLHSPRSHSRRTDFSNFLGSRQYTASTQISLLITLSFGARTIRIGLISARWVLDAGFREFFTHVLLENWKCCKNLFILEILISFHVVWSKNENCYHRKISLDFICNF